MDLKEDKTALMLAVEMKKHNVLEELLKKNIEKEMVDKEGKTALQLAIDLEDIKSQQLIIEYGADVSNELKESIIKGPHEELRLALAHNYIKKQNPPLIDYNTLFEEYKLNDASKKVILNRFNTAET
mmetsp:Transcript_1620/g.2427  ORF Transcript_1620/g.2427 Transcript_1620/m.2427 type:complete len:127 (+) Transcript_1620:1499-1879(+)